MQFEIVLKCQSLDHKSKGDMSDICKAIYSQLIADHNADCITDVDLPFVAVRFDVKSNFDILNYLREFLDLIRNYESDYHLDKNFAVMCAVYYETATASFVLSPGNLTTSLPIFVTCYPCD